MAGSLLTRVMLLLLLLPAAVSAAALDDYYLARFGEKGSAAKVLAEALPGEVPAERCLTPLYRALKRDWAKLEPETQRILAKRVLRPVLPDDGRFKSPAGHFTVHYAKSGSEAPDLIDKDSNGVPDWVEKVAAVFDHVYEVEVTEMGYRPPPVASYDIYLRNLVSDGAYGFTCYDGVPTYPTTSVRSYIEIDRAFSDPVFTAGGRYTPDELLEVTAAHEFHHAIQYGYTYYFDMWYAEVTSTWMEDEVFNSVNQLYSYLPRYLPYAGTLPLNAPPGGNSEYGRWIFNRYLAEGHSPALIRDIWVRLGATAGPGSGDDIPTLPVIDAVVKGSGGTLAGDLLAFARKLYLRDWKSHTDDVSLIPTVDPQDTYSSYPVEMTAINAKVTVLPSYAFAFYRFLPSPSAPANLVLTLANVPAAMEVVAIKKGSDGSVTEYPLDRATGSITVRTFNSTGTSEVGLIICNSPGAAAPVAVASGSSKGSGCFIATAAYGSYLHPKVALLRDFRDRHLLTNAPGRLFVSLYYRVSPPVALIIGQHQWMRAGVRVLLTPLVLAVEHPLAALGLLLLCMVMPIRRLTRCGTGFTKLIEP